MYIVVLNSYLNAKLNIMTFEGSSTVNFIDNYADGNGGVINVHASYSYIDTRTITVFKITFDGSTTVSFIDNSATGNGGVMYIVQFSTITFEESSTINFVGNNADSNGGVMYIDGSSTITFEGNSTVKFVDNNADSNGGVMYIDDSCTVTFEGNSTVNFTNNGADHNGGVMYIIDSSTNNFGGISTIIISYANNYGGVMYIDQNSTLLFKRMPTVVYNGNTAYLGGSVWIKSSWFVISKNSWVTFINNTALMDGGAIYLRDQSNFQLQEYSNATFYNNSAGDYGGAIYALYNNLTSMHFNNFAYFKGNTAGTTQSSVYINVDKSCDKDCFLNSITNKNDIPIATSPNRLVLYNPTKCIDGNETDCDTYYMNNIMLRENQCRPHRSSTACGSCEEGYTLSFDSPECVDIKRCTVGTILITTLSLLYWIAVVIAVFAMMYFKVAFGSLYAIVYYYSVVDILLSRALFISNGLYTTVTIMSSLAKLTPQFLGQLCLVKNMSGIDQQFIHYVHPVVVFLILVLISRLARRSPKVSSLVSKGIISFICFLLLSYTSVASTSLLQMRPLTFVGIDKVYTYLSPDIKYFHGRHIAYAIVALILTITIVIGFPLLLLFEPFLNSKINFIKIKPLLDQFQGCYKDKYRYFAGYYMICRLVIILLVIVKISDDFTTQYLLISSCALMQLIHVLVRPYASTIHNIFDGIILQLIVIISVLPVIEFVDQYDETFVIVTIYLLMILPLISFIAIKIWINKKIILIAYCKYKNIFISCYYNEVATDDPQEPVEMREFGVIVDENMRRNAIIVDV